VLEHSRGFTLDALTAAAYDSYLPWFERTIPALVRAWDGTAATDPLKAKLQRQIALLRAWDLRWSETSVPTSLAVFWGEHVSRRVGREARGAGMPVEDYVATRAAAGELLEALSAASDTLAAGFGTWRTPWGEVNRFQRLTGDIVQPFSDAGPSIPVGFTSSLWGSLASFGARVWPGTRKWYGTSGNSFVAVVEFGPTVRAKAVTAGGESGDPKSPHFNDQAKRYSTGDLRDVYFYPAQLKGHIEREYHPGS
jgi:acyl-homoserine lactone acylase PvdQ